MESGELSFDFEAFFHAHYAGAARAVARVTGDSARAEDLAAEALWKLWRTPKAHGECGGGLALPYRGAPGSERIARTPTARTV